MTRLPSLLAPLRRGGPDPVVFGDRAPKRDLGGPLAMLCPLCDVKWARGAGEACWICGWRT